MNNLFKPNVKEEIFSRIDKLTPTTKPVWGKMNVNQGLWHMAKAFEIATGKLNPTPVNTPSMPKWLLRFFLLNVKPPKERAETFLELNTVSNGINPADFESERIHLKASIDNFLKAASLASENKLVGKFSKDDWGKLNFNHTDHHLRQFGV